VIVLAIGRRGAGTFDDIGVDPKAVIEQAHGRFIAPGEGIEFLRGAAVRIDTGERQRIPRSPSFVSKMVSSMNRDKAILLAHAPASCSGFDDLRENMELEASFLLCCFAWVIHLPLTQCLRNNHDQVRIMPGHTIRSAPQQSEGN
jgi:hypothetical protein